MASSLPETPSSTGSTATASGTDSLTASIDASTGKIDFVDIILYTSFALGVDALGLIPAAGEVMSPLGIFAFRVFFWLKGVNSKYSNMAMAITGGSELIPGLSEVLPGCTGYVLTECLGSILSETTGSLAVEPGALPKSIGQAGATRSTGALNEKTAAESASESGTAGAPTATGGAAQSRATEGATAAGGAAAKAPSASLSTGEEPDFSGQVDFSSFGKPASSAGPETRSPSGLPQGGPPASADNTIAPAVETGEGQRFTSGSPTSPGPGPIYSMETAREEKKQKKAA